MASRKATRIFERMRQSPAGWQPRDFETLYVGFGFEMIHGKRHDVFIHSEYAFLRDTIPRHGELPKSYAREAVKRIEQLLELESKGNG